MNNITNLFEQCYIFLMPIHVCMQQIHMVVIKYLTLPMVNEWKLENHQQLYSPLKPISENHHMRATKPQE